MYVTLFPAPGTLFPWWAAVSSIGIRTCALTFYILFCTVWLKSLGNLILHEEKNGEIDFFLSNSFILSNSYTFFSYYHISKRWYKMRNMVINFWKYFSKQPFEVCAPLKMLPLNVYPTKSLDCENAQTVHELAVPIICNRFSKLFFTVPNILTCTCTSFIQEQ